MIKVRQDLDHYLDAGQSAVAVSKMRIDRFEITDECRTNMVNPDAVR